MYLHVYIDVKTQQEKKCGDRRNIKLFIYIHKEYLNVIVYTCKPTHKIFVICLSILDPPPYPVMDILYILLYMCISIVVMKLCVCVLMDSSTLCPYPYRYVHTL